MAAGWAGIGVPSAAAPFDPTRKATGVSRGGGPTASGNDPDSSTQPHPSWLPLSAAYDTAAAPVRQSWRSPLTCNSRSGIYDRYHTQWLLITIIIAGALGVLILGVLVLCCRNRCKRTSIFQRLLGNEGVRGSYGTAAKMWLDGENPTETLSIDIEGRAKAVLAALQRPEEDVTRLSRSALNYCRSTGHERMLKSPLPQIGRRRCKFHGLVSDAIVNQRSSAEGGPNEVNLLLTLVTPDALAAGNLLPVTSAKSLASFRSLLTSLNHPFVLPTHDATLALDGHLALLRPLSPEGSLRDMMYACSPLEWYHTKYEQLDRMSGAVLTRPAPRGLRVEVVARVALQVLHGCKYLESQGVPYFHLHTGNVVMHDGVARVSDYENAFLGLKHRLHRKLRRLPRVDPGLSSFVALLYEISTGVEVQAASRTHRRGMASPSGYGSDFATACSPSPSPSPAPPMTAGSPATSSPNGASGSGSGGLGLDLHIRDPKYAEVNDLIQKIVGATHEISYDELFTHPLFRDVSLPPLPRDPPRVVDSRAAKLLAPVLSHVSTVLYPGHPSLCSITLPARNTATTMSRDWTTTTTSAASSPRASVVGSPAPGSSSLSASLLSPSPSPAPESPARPGSSVGNGSSPREKEKKQKKDRKKKDRAATNTSDDEEH